MIEHPGEIPAGPRLAREAGRAVFGSDVEGYERGRMGYPAALYEWVLEPVAGRSSTLVEIGPGTGLATVDLLAADPARLFAVEPDAALAVHLRHRFASTAVQVVECDFLSAPLPGPVDLVASAASFHWLDPELALARTRILLARNGRIALWWNVYRQAGVGDPLADAIVPLLDRIELPPSEGPEGHYSLDAALHRRQLQRAGFVLEREHVFRHERILATAEVTALYASYSFVRTLPAAQRTDLLATIEDLVETRFRGLAPNVVLTPLYIARLAA
jgi:hypothetical protein